MSTVGEIKKKSNVRKSERCELLVSRDRTRQDTRVSVSCFVAT